MATSIYAFSFYISRVFLTKARRTSVSFVAFSLNLPDRGVARRNLTPGNLKLFFDAGFMFALRKGFRPLAGSRSVPLRFFFGVREFVYIIRKFIPSELWAVGLCVRGAFRRKCKRTRWQNESCRSVDLGRLEIEEK